jgi:hypothetical protein
MIKHSGKSGWKPWIFQWHQSWTDTPIKFNSLLTFCYITFFFPF